MACALFALVPLLASCSRYYADSLLQSADGQAVGAPALASPVASVGYVESDNAPNFSLKLTEQALDALSSSLSLYCSSERAESSLPSISGSLSTFSDTTAVLTSEVLRLCSMSSLGVNVSPLMRAYLACSSPSDAPYALFCANRGYLRFPSNRRQFVWRRIGATSGAVLGTASTLGLLGRTFFARPIFTYHVQEVELCLLVVDRATGEVVYQDVCRMSGDPTSAADVADALSKAFSRFKKSVEANEAVVAEN